MNLTTATQLYNEVYAVSSYAASAVGFVSNYAASVAGFVGKHASTSIPYIYNQFAGNPTFDSYVAPVLMIFCVYLVYKLVFSVAGFGKRVVSAILRLSSYLFGVLLAIVAYKSGIDSWSALVQTLWYIGDKMLALFAYYFLSDVHWSNLWI